MRPMSGGMETGYEECRRSSINPGSLSQSLITQASQSIAAALHRGSAYFCIKFLFHVIFSPIQAYYKNGVQGGRIKKPAFTS